MSSLTPQETEATPPPAPIVTSLDNIHPNALAQIRGWLEQNPFPLQAVMVRGFAEAVPTGGDVPIGGIISYGGSTDPDNFFICDGRQISRSTYADLFSKIGVTYGTGDGSATFTIPDLRGRFGVGPDGTFGALGATGGDTEFTLTEANMPSHDHTISPNPHSHSFQQAGLPAGAFLQGGPNYNVSLTAVNTTNQSLTIGDAGGDGPVEHLPPYVVVNQIIRHS